MPSVIFINRFFYPDHSATSQILSDVAFHLADVNYDVKIVTSRLQYDNPDEVFPSNENVNGVDVRRVWTTKFGRSNLVGRAVDYLSFYLSALFALLLTVKPGDYVVAKTDPPMISIVAKMVCFLKSAKLINWCQDLFPEVGSELGIRILEYVNKPLLYLRNNSLKNAYSNVVIGETMRDKLISIGVKDSKIRVIPNWSDGERIYPVNKDDNPLIKEWGLENKFIVGYSGNMGRAHEFNTILDIANDFNDNNKIVFVFIGGGARKEWIESEVNKRNLSNVIFKPYQSREHLALSLSVPDIHFISLLPALEGLIVPSKYYGVAAAGRACLFIGDIDGEISRILKSKDCGKAIPVGDVKSGVKYITEMMQSENAHFSQGKNARKVFLENYDANIAFEMWEKLLQ